MNSIRKLEPSNAPTPRETPESQLLHRMAQFISELSDDRSSAWEHPAFTSFLHDVREIIRNSH